MTACPSCNSTRNRITPGPHPGGHGDKLECADCGRYLRWLPKPENERTRRPAGERSIPKRMGVERCDICGRHRDELPKGQTLVGHHCDEYQDGGRVTEGGRWSVVCTACHALIHWIRTYWVSLATETSN